MRTDAVRRRRAITRSRRSIQASSGAGLCRATTGRGAGSVAMAAVPSILVVPVGVTFMAVLGVGDPVSRAAAGVLLGASSTSPFKSP